MPRRRGAAKVSALLVLGVVAHRRRQLFGRGSNGSAFSGRSLKGLLGMQLVAPRSGGRHQVRSVDRSDGGVPEALSGALEAGMEFLNFGARFAVALVPAFFRAFSKPLPVRKRKAAKTAANTVKVEVAKKALQAKVIRPLAVQQGAEQGLEQSSNTSERKAKITKKRQVVEVLVLPMVRRRIERSCSRSEEGSQKPALQLEGGRSGGGRGNGLGAAILLAFGPRGRGSDALCKEKCKKACAHHDDAVQSEDLNARAAERLQAISPRMWRLARDKLPSPKRIDEEDSRPLHGDAGRQDLHELVGRWVSFVPVFQDISGGDPGMSSEAWGGLDADRVARWLATAPAKFDIFVDGEDDVELDRLVLDRVDEWLSDVATRQTSSDMSEAPSWQTSFDMSEGDDPLVLGEVGDWELMVSDSVGRWLATQPLLYFNICEDDMLGEVADWERLVSDRVGRWLATQPMNVDMATGDGDLPPDEVSADLVSEYSSWDRIGVRLARPAVSFDISQGDMDVQPHEILTDIFCESNLWRNLVSSSGSRRFFTPLGRSNMPRNIMLTVGHLRMHDFAFRCGESLPAALMLAESQQGLSREWSAFELEAEELEECMQEGPDVPSSGGEDVQVAEESHSLHEASLPTQCQEEFSGTGSTGSASEIEEEGLGESAMEPLSMSLDSDAHEAAEEEVDVEEVAIVPEPSSPVESTVESLPGDSESDSREEKLGSHVQEAGHDVVASLTVELLEGFPITASESSLKDKEETEIATPVLPPVESQQEFSRQCSEEVEDELKEEGPVQECVDGSLNDATDAQMGGEAAMGELGHAPPAPEPVDCQQELLMTGAEPEFAEEESWERTPACLGMSMEVCVTAQAVEELGRWLQGSFWLARYFSTFLERGYDNLAALRTAEADEVNDLIAGCGMPRVHAQLFKLELQQLRFAEHQASSAAADQDTKPHGGAPSQEHSTSGALPRLVSTEKPGVHGKLQATVEDSAHKALQHVRRSEVDAFVELWQWLHGRHLARYAGGFAERGFRSLTALEAADTRELQDLVANCDLAPGHARLLLRELGRVQRPQGELCEEDLRELAATAGWSYAPNVDMAV